MPAQPAAGARVKRLLIVEDDEVLGRELVRRTRDLGWQAELAASVEPALSAVGRAPLAMLLCDLRLPGGNGLRVIAAAAALDPQPHIIAMTGMVDAGFYLEVARRAGAHGVLAKPFTAAQLAAVLAGSPSANPA